MADRMKSLNVLLDPEGKMLLSEAYDGVLANVQKATISGKIKNTDLSGDPLAAHYVAKQYSQSCYSLQKSHRKLF